MNKNANNLESLLPKYFDTAFDSSNGIKELRGLILKLAMMGKLVPQNADDQPASELLKETPPFFISLHRSGLRHTRERRRGILTYALANLRTLKSICRAIRSCIFLPKTYNTIK